MRKHQTFIRTDWIAWRTTIGLSCRLRRIAFTVLSIMIVGQAFAQASSSTPRAQTETPGYRIVRSWGVGAVAVLSDSNVSEAALRSLADKLRSESPAARTFTVEVYSTPRAAAMRDEGTSDRLKLADEKYWERHRVAEYTRNSKTGYHRFSYWIDGTAQVAPAKFIDLPRP